MWVFLIWVELFPKDKVVLLSKFYTHQQLDVQYLQEQSICCAI